MLNVRILGSDLDSGPSTRSSGIRPEKYKPNMRATYTERAFCIATCKNGDFLRYEASPTHHHTNKYGSIVGTSCLETHPFFASRKRYYYRLFYRHTQLMPPGRVTPFTGNQKQWILSNQKLQPGRSCALVTFNVLLGYCL
jgi:hypothetical protein